MTDSDSEGAPEIPLEQLHGVPRTGSSGARPGTSPPPPSEAAYDARNASRSSRYGSPRESQAGSFWGGPNLRGTGNSRFREPPPPPRPRDPERHYYHEKQLDPKIELKPLPELQPQAEAAAGASAQG